MYGLEPLGLLLFFGDLATARTGFAKALHAHKRVLARVRQGAASVDGCVHAPAVSCARPEPRRIARRVLWLVADQ